jgi:hypothetical protein
MPLSELWDERGIVSARKLRDVDAEDVVALLRLGKVQFIVANIGDKLEWVALNKCYEFWKSEVKSHLANHESLSPLENFPDQYCYFASEWKPDAGAPIVLLEKDH